MPVPPGWVFTLLDSRALQAQESNRFPLPESLKVGLAGAETQDIIHQLARLNIWKHPNNTYHGLHVSCGPSPVLSNLQISPHFTHTETHEIITIAVACCRNHTS